MTVSFVNRPAQAGASSPLARGARVLNADLHCHSTVSDGTLSPAEVVRRAHANGVELLALTDHDELGGLAEARETADALNMRFVAGVEVSVTWATRTIHIVGLGVDPGSPSLVSGLAGTRSGRDRRALEMGERLEALGIAGAYQGALKYAGNPALVSRTHFARFLVERGHCVDMDEVFERFLTEGRPGYVSHDWASLADAVRWIRDAGGIAVIAHPGRYAFDALALDAFVGAFRAAGGQGMEVVSGSHTPAQYREYAQHARRHGMLASRGSDFHGPDESRVELGSLPPLPADLEPVWHAWT